MKMKQSFAYLLARHALRVPIQSGKDADWNAYEVAKHYQKLARIESLVDRIADKYVEVLADWLTEEELEAVRNGTAYNEHDFCDANMAVDEAFRKCGVEPDTSKADIIELWNNATAKANDILKS